MTRLSNTENGAQSSAVIYSIIETAKANGIDAENYLRHLFDEIPKRNTDDLTGLLPWEFNR